jgi:hypothetical protein
MITSLVLEDDRNELVIRADAVLGPEGRLPFSAGSVVLGVPEEYEELSFWLQYGFQALKAGGEAAHDRSGSGSSG